MDAYNICFEKVVNKGYVWVSKILIDKPVISKGWKSMALGLTDAERMVIFILVTNCIMTDTKVLSDKSWGRRIQVATQKKVHL